MTTSFSSSERLCFVLTACLAFWIAPVSGQAPLSRLDLVEDAFRRVQQVTGPAPVECGRHLRPGLQNPPTRELLDGMLRCAQVASSARKPFWLLVQGLAFDSWYASGLAAGPDGVIKRFQHRSDSYSSAPPVTFTACGRPDLRINADGWAFVSCEAPALMEDLFIGLGNCLGVDTPGSLAPRTRLVVLAAEHTPSIVPVESVSAVASAKCSHRWLSDLPAVVGRVQLPATINDEVVFAIQDSASLRMVGGRSERLSDAQAMTWFRAAGSSVRGLWREPGVLVHAYRYAGAGGQTAIELYVGRPVLNPSGSTVPIRAISIRRLFFIGGKLLATQDYDRTSGAEERVDTEPPQLTFLNWSRSDTEQTVAFISSDTGKSWRRLSTNIGFEGINWIVQRLDDELPEERRFAYTPH